MNKIAVMVSGPPGAGKGTQANLLANKYNLIHFDSGKYLRSILHNPKNQEDPTIKRERKLNDEGVLNTPSWVLNIFKEETQRIANSGKSVVYSGSPRTMYEAFGDGKNTGLIKTLQTLYGKNIVFFSLQITPEEGAKRNKKRRVCEVCGIGVLASANIKTCPVCAGKMKIRVDDSPEITKKRIKEYTSRTKPIISEIKKTGIKVINIKGEQKPFEVFYEIEKKLKAFL